MNAIKLTKPIPPHIRFHKKVWYNKTKNSPGSFEGLPKSWTQIFSKAYPRLKKVDMSRPILPLCTLKSTLDKRKSQRTFSQEELSLRDMSSFLYYACGIKDKESGRRHYPSAGGRYPLEVYVIPLQGRNKLRLFHYYPHEHILENIGKTDEVILSKVCGDEWSWIFKSGLLIFITAVFKRTTHKYGEKGYDFALLEAGHMGQNMYLVSEALGLGCCALGGYDNRLADKLLDIDGVRETVIYTLTVGRGLT